jgi:hypothetical protein
MGRGISVSVFAILFLVGGGIARGGSRDLPAELGQPVERLSDGDYASSDAKHLLRNIKVSSWADEMVVDADLSYVSGSVAWTKIHAAFTQVSGNTYEARLRYAMRGPYRICFVPVTLTLKAYENGFLLKNYQPQLIDVDYCLFYQYRTFHEAAPYLRK